MIMQRRSFLIGLGSLLAAPAIVHAGNIMPVKAITIRAPSEFELEMLEAAKQLGGDFSIVDLRTHANAWADQMIANVGSRRKTSERWDQQVLTHVSQTQRLFGVH